MPEEVVVVCPGDPLPERFDGLLVSGGADVEPSRYGEAATSPTLELAPERDAQDFELFARAQRLEAPVFGICRGMQMLNVALGGTLWQDLPQERDRGLTHEYPRAEWDPAHPAHVVRPRARQLAAAPLSGVLSAAGEFTVNSRHHQGVKDIAHGLVPLAASPDDLVEAFERPGQPFLAGVQWHPEDIVKEPVQKAMLAAFLEECRRYAQGRGTGGAPPIEVRLEGHIPVVVLNRPAKRNAFAGAMRQMLAGTIDALGSDPTVPAIVITGAGGAFSAGGDLDVLRALVRAEDVDGFRELLQNGARAVLSVVSARCPVIAAVDGAAAGAGMNLALACDVRIASADEELQAVFAQSFSAIGLSPDWGGSFHLPLLAGPGVAADLVFSADRIAAHRARELGLVDFVVEEGSSLPYALHRAARYAERPAAALAAAKRNLNAERLPRLMQALERETEAQIELFQSGLLARSLPRPKPSESREIA